MNESLNNRVATELLCLSPETLMAACGQIAQTLLGETLISDDPGGRLRETILSHVLFESITRQQRKEARLELST